MMRDQGPSIGENGLRGLEWDRTWGVQGLGDWDQGLTLTSIVKRFSDALRASVLVRWCNPSLSTILPPIFTEIGEASTFEYCSYDARPLLLKLQTAPIFALIYFQRIIFLNILHPLLSRSAKHINLSIISSLLKILRSSKYFNFPS